jgi:hypothetical protein
VRTTARTALADAETRLPKSVLPLIIEPIAIPAAPGPTAAGSG